MSRKKYPPGLALRYTFAEHSQSITRIAWSPDGHMLASPSEDRTIRLWDGATGRLLRTLTGHTDSINTVAWSPDGSMLASASDDATINLWNTQTGQCLRTLKGHRAGVKSVDWEPHGHSLASGSEDGTLRLWDTLTGQRLHTLLEQEIAIKSLAYMPEGSFLSFCSDDGFFLYRDHTCQSLPIKGWRQVMSMAWSRDGQRLAIGCDDGRIDLWQTGDGEMPNAGNNLALAGNLEGHTDWVTSLSFSGDGGLLASKSRDGKIRLWRTDTWETVAIIEEPASGKLMPGIAFHPSEPVLATLGEEDMVVHVWELDVPALLNAEQEAPTSLYRNAKVVLVGDSGVGKSGLGLVLAGKQFVPTESTHARYIWTFDSRTIQLEGGREETREIFLWDLAGQPGYRLIHQLHLNEVTLALLVTDAHSETNPFVGIHHWVRALWVAEHSQGAAITNAAYLKKFLVSARIDRGGIAVSRERIDRLVKELRFDGFFETSAKEGRGIAELAEVIKQGIDWEILPKVSSTRLFQEIKGFLVTEKEAGRVLATGNDLYHKFLQQQKRRDEDLRAQFETCIEQMETQGVIRKLSFADLVLLQPELIDAYASALINAVRDEPDGLGSIEEEEVYAGVFYIPASGRLPDKEQERLLLIAMIEDLLRSEITLRERTEDGTYLVFPSQSTRENDELPEPEQKIVAFRFEGPVQNIYATLAVRLSHSGLFERKELWHNGITYKAETGAMCGLLLRNFSEGRAELTLFFEMLEDSEESQALRQHFEEYVYEHLRRRAIAGSIQRRHFFSCPNCGEQFTNEQVLRRQQRGFDKMTCSVCDTVFSIAEHDEKPEARSHAVVLAMNRSADARREHEATASLYVTPRLRNPYYEISGLRNPALFVGRANLLARLFSAIVPRQSISLLGSRRIGKSALIQHMYRPGVQRQFARARDLSHHLFVLIDLGEFLYKTSEDFFRTVSEHIIARLQEKLGQRFEKPHLPEQMRGDDLFEAVLEQAMDHGFHTVLLLDGFDNILRNKSFDREFLDVLRSLVSAGKVSYVITSIEPLAEICHKALVGSPFFNIFGTPYRLEALTREEAEQLIQEPSRLAGYPFTEAETTWVLSLAGYHPFFIQRVCYFLFEEKIAGNGIPDLNRVKSQVYNDLLPHFNHMWVRLSAEEQQELFKHKMLPSKDTSWRSVFSEFSASDLFQDFVHEKAGTSVLQLNVAEIEKALERIDDPVSLGTSQLRFLNSVARRCQGHATSVLETGRVIREILKEAWERLQGDGERTDYATEWHAYNILYYRYFRKQPLKNDQIAARLAISTRQYYRERSKAIEVLINVLLEMEAQTKIKNGAQAESP